MSSLCFGFNVPVFVTLPCTLPEKETTDNEEAYEEGEDQRHGKYKRCAARIGFRSRLPPWWQRVLDEIVGGD